LGNMLPPARRAFLMTMRTQMADGDTLLLGIDLVKEPTRLIAAYDDSRGTSAAFARNALSVINAALGGNFNEEAFQYVVWWNPDQEWIDMRLRSTRNQTVRVDYLDTEINFAQCKEIRTEISAKFRKERLSEDLASLGLGLSRWWTNSESDFALSLWRPI
jgi:L-histidine N-alpha-methyltransferase